MSEDLMQKGWVKFPAEPSVRQWAADAFHVAQQRVRAPEEQKWLRAEGTWFVGVDSLPNDSQGRVGRSGPLAGVGYGIAQSVYGALPLHCGQISVIYPGYPKPVDGESDSAFGYRKNRDAAHVDGLIPVGDARRRHLLERHAYILGVPLTACASGASPISVWEGSHVIMREVFERALEGVDASDWARVDLTETYQAARRVVFETCPRVLIAAQPGEVYIVHRLALHGVSPWQEGADAPEDGRMIVYFRPEWPDAGDKWLTAP